MSRRMKKNDKHKDTSEVSNSVNCESLSTHVLQHVPSHDERLRNANAVSNIF
jgi:hypothetical protein